MGHAKPRYIKVKRHHMKLSEGAGGGVASVVVSSARPERYEPEGEGKFQRGKPRMWVTIPDMRVWSWAEDRAESAGYNSIGEYICELMRQDRQAMTTRAKRKAN